MRVDQVLRAARQHSGTGQRPLARLAGVSASSLADAESRRRQPGWATVQAAVEAAGLSLVLAPRTPELTPEQRAFLDLPLVERLYRALGGQGDRRLPRGWSPAWTELRWLAERGACTLSGRTGLACWVEGALLPRPLTVSREWWSPRCDVSGLEHVVVDGETVPTPGQWTLWLPRRLRVPDALALSLRPDCAVEAPLLRAAVAHHDDEAGRDLRARRLGAHKRGARGATPWDDKPLTWPLR